MKKLNLVSKILFGLALGLMLVLGAGAITTPAAYAAPPQQQGNHTRLEYGLRLAELHLKGQQNRLDLARDGAALAQDFIDEQKKNGKDTADIQAALDEFNRQIEAAQAKHDQAQQIFEIKAGFDADGQVTDADQARETLQDIREAMREAGETLRRGLQDFRQAMRDFRQANRPGGD
jgi:hypothetical protein